MRKTFTLICFLLAFCYTLLGQNRASIKGRVIDSLNKTDIEFATVAVVNPKDSSLISYTLTDKNGNFLLRNLPAERDLKLVASHIGYTNYRKLINLQKGEEFDLKVISLAGTTLQEVIVKAERPPVVFKKDTIEFNAEAFKVRPNAVVEELLKKMPGIQIDNDGSITVNGKTVSRVKVDGKEFFGDDPKMATRNLDADLIDKIQVIDDRENDPDHKIPDSQVGKIINLKLKRAIKRSTFGKVYAGGGSLDRYESGGLFNMFRDTLQVSLIGIGNNLSKTGFSSQELMESGGFDRSGQNDLWDGTVNTGGRSWGGMQSVITGGANINTDYGKKLKMNLMYFYSRSENLFESSYSNQQFLKDTTFFSRGTSNSDQNENKHTAKGLVEWRPDTLSEIRYTPRLSFSGTENNQRSTANSSSNFAERLTENASSGTGNNSSFQFQHSFNYHRRLKKKGETLNISHNTNINPNSGKNYNNNDLLSYNNTLRSDTLRQLQNRETKNVSLSLDLNYRYPLLKKLTLDISAGAGFDKNGELLEQWRKNKETGNYDLFQINQSNDLDREQWTQGVKPNLNFEITKKLRAEAGVRAQWRQITNKFSRNVADLNQNYFNLLPAVRVSGDKFSMSYDMYVNQPSISEIQPVTYTYSPLYSYSGNPNLKQSKSHNIYANYYTYNHERQTNYTVYLSGNFEQNSVVRKRTLSSNQAQTQTPINMNGRYYLYFSSSFGKRFKKGNNWQVGVNNSIGTQFSRDFFLLNLQEGWQHRISPRFNQQLTLNWKDVIDLSSSYVINLNYNRYINVNYQNQRLLTHDLDNRFTVRWPKKVIWEGNYQYKYNPQVSAGFRKSNNLLNAAVSVQMLKKDQGQIKLSVYDLMDQNIPVYRYVYENTIYDQESKILRRYFLLTYQYKFNKTSTK